MRDAIMLRGGSGMPEQELTHLVADVRDYAILLLDPQGNVLTWNSSEEPDHGDHRSSYMAATSRIVAISCDFSALCHELGGFRGKHLLPHFFRVVH